MEITDTAAIKHRRARSRSPQRRRSDWKESPGERTDQDKAPAEATAVPPPPPSLFPSAVQAGGAHRIVDTHVIRLGKDADNEVRLYEKHLATLTTPHVLRAIAAANDPLTVRAPILPAQVPSHMILAAERGIFPRPLGEVMRASSRGLVDTIQHACGEARGVRERQMIRRLNEEEARGRRVRALKKARLPVELADKNRSSVDERIAASVRDHPYFTSTAAAAAAAGGDASTATVAPVDSLAVDTSDAVPSSPSVVPSATPLVDALLSSAYFTTRFVHQFEDATLTSSQHRALRQCRTMEHYKRNTKRDLQARRESGRLKAESASGPRIVHARHQRVYRFNGEESDESETEDHNRTFLTGIVADEPPMDEFQTRIMKESREYDLAASSLPALSRRTSTTSRTSLPMSPSRPLSSPSTITSPRRRVVAANTASSNTPNSASSRTVSLTSRGINPPPPPAAPFVRRDMSLEVSQFHLYALKRDRQDQGHKFLLDEQKELVEELANECDTSRTDISANSSIPNATAAASSHRRAKLEHFPPTIEGLHAAMVEVKPKPAPLVDASGALVAPPPPRQPYDRHSPFYVDLANWMHAHGKLRKQTIDAGQIERCARMFELLDANGDGTVSVCEMQSALRELGMRVDLNHLRLRMREFDPDADGDINREEFTHGVNSIATWEGHIGQILREQALVARREETLRKEALRWQDVREKEVRAEKRTPSRAHDKSHAPTEEKTAASPPNRLPVDSAATASRTGTATTTTTVPPLRLSSSPLPRSSIDVPPLPLSARGAASGLSLEERQSIACLRARTTRRTVQAEARSISLTSQRVAATIDATSAREHEYARALARLEAKSAPRALPEEVARRLHLGESEAAKRLAAKKDHTQREANGATQAENAMQTTQTPSQSSPGITVPTSTPAAPVHSTRGGHNVPFFLWVPAFQRHTRLSALIAAHQSEQAADVRAQALEVETTRAELEATFNAAVTAAAEEGTPIAMPSFADALDSPRNGATGTGGPGPLTRLSFAASVMPLLNYRTEDEHIRPATATMSATMTATSNVALADSAVTERAPTHKQDDTIASLIAAPSEVDTDSVRPTTGLTLSPPATALSTSRRPRSPPLYARNRPTTSGGDGMDPSLIARPGTSGGVGGGVFASSRAASPSKSPLRSRSIRHAYIDQRGGVTSTPQRRPPMKFGDTHHTPSSTWRQAQRGATKAQTAREKKTPTTTRAEPQGRARRLVDTPAPADVKDATQASGVKAVSVDPDAMNASVELAASSSPPIDSPRPTSAGGILSAMARQAAAASLSSARNTALRGGARLGLVLAATALTATATDEEIAQFARDQEDEPDQDDETDETDQQEDKTTVESGTSNSTIDSSRLESAIPFVLSVSHVAPSRRRSSVAFTFAPAPLTMISLPADGDEIDGDPELDTPIGEHSNREYYDHYATHERDEDEKE